MQARVLLLAFALAAAGCLRAGGAAESAPARDLSRIAADEISSGHWNYADDIVRALRPQWLAYRGPDSILGAPGGVQVRMDDMWIGGVSSLRGVSRLDVDSIAFIDPVSAAGRWGGNFRDGVILIYGRRGPRPDTTDTDTSRVR